MSIADKITSIENHLSADYEGLTNLGIDLTGINKNIENIKPCLDTIWNNLPKVSDTGTEVTLSPTLKGKLGIVEKGNSIQEGTPSPSSPSPIKSVTGNNNVVVIDQLFNATLEQGTISADNGATSSSTTRLRTQDFIEVEPNTTYYIKCSDETNFYDRFFYYQENNTFISASSTFNVWAGSFTTPNNCTKLKVIFRNSSNTTIQTTDITGIKLYKDSQTLPLNLGSIELNSIETIRDLIFHNVPNNPYYNNTLDEGAWYKKEKIPQYIVDGTNNVFSNFSSVAYNRCQVNINGKIPTSYHIINAYCNYFSPNVDVYRDTYDVVGFCSGNNSSSFLVRFGSSSEINTQAKANAWAKLLFDNNNPLKFYYQTNNIQDIKITDTTLVSQLEAIDKAQSYNGTTIITSTYDSNNAQMILQVSSLKGE